VGPSGPIESATTTTMDLNLNVNLELLPFSFVAGVATFFSPCFGAMLPTYVSLYLARQEANAPVGWVRRGLQGLWLGGLISAGMLTSLGLLGAVFAVVGSAIGQYLPWVAVGVALGIVIAGVVLLVRPEVSLSLGGVVGRWLSPRAGSGLFSFYFYGLVYAICAAACTLPIFLSVMMQTFLGGPLNGVVHFAAYGWGMSLMMLGFGVLLAYAKGFVQRVFRSMGAWVRRASGAFMIVAGGYVLYYLLIYGRYLDDLLRR